MTLDSIKKSDLFVSVVAPVRNTERYIDAYVREVSAVLSSHFKDYEIVLVDDRSHDNTVARIHSMQLTVPNLQLYCLARRIGLEGAFVVGLERAIGDVVITMDPCSDPAAPILDLIDKYYGGYEIIYGLRHDRLKYRGADPYQWFARAFYGLYRVITREDVPMDLSSLRLLSRRIVNAFLENRDRHSLFMVIAAFAGFPYATLEYDRLNRSGEPARADYVDAVGRAISMLLLSSKRPLRFVTYGSLLGAFLSVLYGLYVLVVHLFEDGLAEGWASLSLQISGLFFLQFLILGMMSEYLIRIFVHSQNRLPYLIARESSSMVLSRKLELNVAQARHVPEAHDAAVGSDNAMERDPATGSRFD